MITFFVLFKPNFKILGPKLGKQINKISEYLKNVDEITCDNILQGNAVVIDGIKISSNEIDVILNKKEEHESFKKRVKLFFFNAGEETYRIIVHKTLYFLKHRYHKLKLIFILWICLHSPSRFSVILIF